VTDAQWRNRGSVSCRAIRLNTRALSHFDGDAGKFLSSFPDTVRALHLGDRINGLGPTQRGTLAQGFTSLPFS